MIMMLKAFMLSPQAAAKSKEPVDMEACFSQLTLDVIGKAVFNYDFNALNTDSPLIQVHPLTHLPPPCMPVRSICIDSTCRWGVTHLLLCSLLIGFVCCAAHWGRPHADGAHFMI